MLWICGPTQASHALLQMLQVLNHKMAMGFVPSVAVCVFFLFTTPPFSVQFCFCPRVFRGPPPARTDLCQLFLFTILAVFFLHECLRKRSMICLQWLFHDSIMSLFMRQLHIFNMWTRASRKSIKVRNSTNLKKDPKHQMFFLSICQQKEAHDLNNGDRFALKFNCFFFSCLINVMLFFFRGRFEED